MDTKNALAIFVIAAAMVIAMIPMAIPASADKSDAQDGLNEADNKIHENTGPPVPSDEDIRFHEGTCKGGHTTDALEGLGGCDVLTEPGNSDDKP